jgi:DNA-binding XRE family transcriptional regulator
MQEKKCPKCGKNAVLLYKSFKDTDTGQVLKIPVFTCPNCGMLCIDDNFVMRLEQEQERIEINKELNEELKNAKTNKEIKEILDKYTIRNNIKSVINKHGMSMTRIAKIMDVSRTYIYLLATKNETTNIETAFKLAKIIGVNINDIYYLAKKDEKIRNKPLPTIVTNYNEEINKNDEKLKNELKKYRIKCCVSFYLKDKKLKYVDVAERLGITPQALNKKLKYRPNKVRIETGLKLAKAIGADINDIYQLIKTEDMEVML